MNSIGNAVKELLDGTGAAVWYFYPQSWLRLPAISWRESRNRELAQADGREYLTELEYTVDVWDKSPERVRSLAEDVDGALCAMRLRRDYAADLFESGMHHRTMRFRCVADSEGRIYQ